ncbi:MAG: integrase arm-type DNA-binding domain-containing protein [Luteimonas sp.]|nr:integrase arm-type DNA-binding domain-containing protein [Luteimonas sp.]
MTKVKRAAAGKHFDGSGLFLHVMPTGAKYWRLKYRHAGKEKLLALGVYPKVSLAEARVRAEKARTGLRDGIDPAAAKAEAAANARREAEGLFPVVATAWLAWRKPEWTPETYRQTSYILETYLAPALRRESIATLTSKAASDALQAIPPSLAVKARGQLGQIVTYAIREGLREDGRLLSLRGAVRKADKGHIPAAVDLPDVRHVLQAVDAYPTPVTRAALTIAMLTAQRPGNVVAMEWAEVDLDAAEWSIPAAKMKTRKAHLVPLPRQAVAVLREMQAYSAGKQYVFPPLARQNTPHLHRDALSGALRRTGLQGLHAAHGFRGMFRTVARERLRIDADVLEAQLAHAKRDQIAKAYDRTAFVAERKVAMQRWADYLARLRKSEDPKVVPLKRTA